MAKPKCQLCGGAMKKRTIRKSGCAPKLMLFAVGLLLFIFIPVVGWVIGGLMILLSPFVGLSQQKIWKCKSCGCAMPRVGFL